MAFAIDNMDGHGLSNKACCGCPAKGDKSEAVLVVHFMQRCI